MYETPTVADQLEDLEHEIIAIKEKMPELRDQFAMAALQGMLANSIPMSKDMTPDKLAFACYSAADAMLAARGEADA